MVRGVELRFVGPAEVTAERATFEITVPPRGEWTTCVEVGPVFDGAAVDPRYRCGEPIDRATPTERLAQWRRQVPHVETTHPGLKEVISRSAEDLGALRIFDPDYPERVVVAAGAPWFMTVFGRDSLLTAWMALLVDPDLARGVLPTSIPAMRRSPAASSTRCASGMPPRCRWGAGASTTGRPTPRRCS